MKSERLTHLLSLIMAIVFFTLLIPTLSYSQGIASGGAGTEGRIEGNFKFLPIPYVNYDRSFGIQLGFLPMAMFNPVKTDTISPSSMAGLLGMYSENETWFLMGFSKMYFDEDNWRVMAAGGRGLVNFQFFLDSPINSWVPYNTEMDMVFVKVQKRIINKVYGGISYVYVDLKTSTDKFPLEQNTILNGLGFSFSMDKRSSVYYPKSGFETSIDYFTYPDFLGNDFVSNKIELTYNHFIPMRRENDILAGRAFVGLGLGDLSFNQQFIVGQTDVRGYTQGAYRGNYKLAVQGEYRWNFAKRWGLVGFAGIATVFEAINKDDDGKFLPGVGTGFRFTVDQETHMNIGLDIAAGLEDWGIYFRIGESF